MHHARSGALGGPCAGRGLITSLARDTAEPLAAVCLLAGLLAIRARRPVLAAALLAYGALTRETVMVAVAAIAIMRVVGILRRRRPLRPGREDLTVVAQRRLTIS